MSRRPYDPERPYLEDANYYRLGYQLAAQLMNVECTVAGRDKSVPTSRDVLYGWFSRGGTPPANRAAARDHATQIEEDADELLAWYRRRSEAKRWTFTKRLDGPEKRLHQFLVRTVKPCLQLVIAASWQGDDFDDLEAEMRVKPLRQAAKEGTISYRALYNLACFEAGAKVEQSYERALEYLEQALEQAPGERLAELAAWAHKDPSLAPLRKGDEFERLLEQFKPRDEAK